MFISFPAIICCALSDRNIHRQPHQNRCPFTENTFNVHTTTVFLKNPFYICQAEACASRLFGKGTVQIDVSNLLLIFRHHYQQP